MITIFNKICCWLGFHKKKYWLGTSTKTQQIATGTTFYKIYDNYSCKHCQKIYKKLRYGTYKP